MLNRRDFTKNAIAGIVGLGAVRYLKAQAVAPKPMINSVYDGINLGVQSASFTFSGMGINEIIRTMRDVGLAQIDVMSEHVENYLGAPVPLPGAGRPGPWILRPPRPAGARPVGPPPADPAKRIVLRNWRMDADLAKFHEVGQRFTDAGLNFFSYNLSFDDSFTDPELDKAFLMTKALGTRIITASSPVEVFPRLKPFAEKYDVIVALHNHTIGPKEFSSALALSEKFWVNLDVGHFFASGYDPVAYIKENNARITNIHIKDRKKSLGDSVPFGEGDTPLPAVFKLLKTEHLTFPACIEYVGPSGPAIELSKCMQYCVDTIRDT
jgi:hypothetical protein